MPTFELEGPDGKTYEVEAPSAEAALGAFKQFSTPKAPEMTVGEVAGDVAKSAGIGVVQGGIGLATLPGNLEALGRTGINAAAGMVGAQPPVSGETFLPTYNDWKGSIEKRTGEFYKPKTTVGEYARTIGEFAPMAVGGPASLGARAAAVALPAVVSETAGQATKGTSLEPWARFGGALLGGRLPNTAARAVTPAPANAARQGAVRALENEGVTALTAGQRTGNERLRWIEDATSMVPGGGGRATAMQQQAAEQFTAAALRRAGIQADRATPDVLDAAFQAMGQEFRGFGRTVSVAPSPQFAARINRTAQRYENLTPESLRIPIVRAVADDIAQVGNRGLTGAQFNSYRSQLREAQRAQRNNPESSRAIGAIIDALDAQMVRSAPLNQRAQIVHQLRDMNGRYRNLLAIEDAALGAGENAALGLLSPAALKTAVKKQNKRDYSTGRSELGQLARAGEAVLKPLRSSGTAERTFAQGIVSTPSAIGTGVGGVLSSGDPWMMLAGALAPPLIKAATARGLMSGPAQRYFANQRIPQEMGRLPFLPSAERMEPGLLPLAAAQAQEDVPLRGGTGPRYENGKLR